MIEAGRTPVLISFIKPSYPRRAIAFRISWICLAAVNPYFLVSFSSSLRKLSAMSGAIASNLSLIIGLPHRFRPLRAGWWAFEIEGGMKLKFLKTSDWHLGRFPFLKFHMVNNIVQSNRSHHKSDCFAMWRFFYAGLSLVTPSEGVSMHICDYLLYVLIGGAPCVLPRGLYTTPNTPSLLKFR